ncbi:hypothetical protein BGW39_010140 [Mortierella sp. 14UC]|nr:hypothetical protein BGW39_010140 [Mortierella sp. 14UC]
MDISTLHLPNQQIRFPDTHLVLLGTKVTQVSTFIQGKNYGDLSAVPLSDKAEALLQKIVWATIMSPPEEDKVQLEHEEFDLAITKNDWRLPDKYDILLEERELEPMRFKLWFDLLLPNGGN